MIKQRYLTLLALGGVALGLGQIQPASASILIDDFIVQQSATTGTTAGPTGIGSVVSPTQSIGSERDLWVQKTNTDSGGGGTQFSANVNPFNAERLRQDSGLANGSTYVTWDGADNNPNPFTGINFSGLGSVDFSGEDNLVIEVDANNIAGPVSVVFYDSTAGGTAFATTTFNVPVLPLNSNQVLSNPFSGFTATGGSLASILDSVGAIQLQINSEAPGNFGQDIQIDFVSTTRDDVSTPEPTSTLGLLALGVIGAGSLLKRKNQK